MAICTALSIAYGTGASLAAATAFYARCANAAGFAVALTAAFAFTGRANAAGTVFAFTTGGSYSDRFAAATVGACTSGTSTVGTVCAVAIANVARTVGSAAGRAGCFAAGC